MPETFFNLGEGESIVKEIKPKSGLKWYFLIQGFGIGSVAAFVIIAFAFMPSFKLVSLLFENVILVALLIVGVGFLLGLLIASLRYNKQYYWLTNKRVIYKRGIIGYRVTSIPYERISDIIISRTFLERIFGFGSLHIQTLAGQVTGTTMLGSEGVLLAIPSPEETQELVFKLIKQKRREEKITF